MIASPRINLFAQVIKKYAHAKIKRKKISQICVMVSGLMCLLTFVVYAIQIRLQSQIDETRREQQVIENQIQAQLVKQVDLGILAVRLDKISSALKSEVDYVKRRDELQNLFTSMDIETGIITLSLSKGTAYSAILQFASRDDVLTFLKVIETDPFQKQIRLMSIRGLRVKRTSGAGDSPEDTIAIEGNFL